MIRISIASVLVVFLTGCANLPPSIDPLFVQVDDQRVRWVEPGTIVTVRAVASDPNRDRLHYRWTTDRDSGSVVVNGLPEARWDVGDSAAIKTLQLMVMDGHGGVAKASVEVSTGPGLVHSGIIYGPDGRPVPGAEVDIDGHVTRTDENGSYSIELTGADANSSRYVMNVRNIGYANFSKVLDDGVTDGSWMLAQATTESVNPASPITVTDTNASTNCWLPYSARIDWDALTDLRVPRNVSATGQLINASVSGQLAAAIDYILAGGQCNPGATVSIPANSLVNAAGNPPPGNIIVSLATVNLTSPDSMPGDWQVRGPEEVGFMESFGAADINVAADGQQYQLKAGEKATVTIPVAGGNRNPIGRETKNWKPSGIPAEVPLLLFDESSATWERHGVARLNVAGTAYVAEVDHFSAYNVDVIKTDPACLRIDSQAISGAYSLDLIIPSSSGPPTYRNLSINNGSGDQEHAVLNLPPNEQIGLIPMRVTPNATCPSQPDVAPIGIFVGTSGNAITGGRLLAGDFSPPYSLCGTGTTLTDITSPGQIVVNGLNHLVGPWPAHFYALANPDNDEIYPLGAPTTCNFYAGGDTSCSLIGIADTGSIRLILQETAPNNLTDTTFSASDAALLGFTVNTAVNVRLNGLGRRDTSGVPEDAPGGARPSEVQLTNVSAQLGSTLNVGPTDLTLIGTNVLRNIVTQIDNTNSTLNIPEIMHVNGYADVRFFNPGDSAIPVPQVTLNLEGWPAVGAQPPRYLIENMRWQEGCEVADDTTNTDPLPLQFLLDTGTAFTAIGNRLANALNLPATGDRDCFAAGDQLGYHIDKLTVTGTGGTYTINNALVCRAPSVISTNIKGRLVDAVIGANFFSQVEMLLDGPNSTLGLSVP